MTIEEQNNVHKNTEFTTKNIIITAMLATVYGLIILATLSWGASWFLPILNNLLSAYEDTVFRLLFGIPFLIVFVVYFAAPLFIPITIVEIVLDETPLNFKNRLLISSLIIICSVSIVMPLLWFILPWHINHFPGTPAENETIMIGRWIYIGLIYLITFFMLLSKRRKKNEATPTK